MSPSPSPSLSPSRHTIQTLPQTPSHDITDKKATKQGQDESNENNSSLSHKQSDNKQNRKDSSRSMKSKSNAPRHYPHYGNSKDQILEKAISVLFSSDDNASVDDT